MADQYNKILTTVNSVTSNYSFTPDLENVIVIDTSNNRIGINTVNPQYSIDVCNGRIRSDSLEVLGDASINNMLEVSNNLIVLGDASINNVLEVSNNLLVKGDASINNVLEVSNNLLVKGNAIFSNNIRVNGLINSHKLNILDKNDSTKIFSIDISSNTKPTISTNTGTAIVFDSIVQFNQPPTFPGGDAATTQTIGGGNIYNTIIGYDAANDEYGEKAFFTNIKVQTDASINNILEVSNNLLVKDHASINNILEVSNNLIVQGDASINNILEVSNNLLVKGDASINNMLEVSNNLLVKGDATINNILEVSNNLLVKGDASINNILEVSNNLLVLGDASINNMLEVSNNLLVKRDASINNMLEVSNNLLVKGDASVNNNLEVSNNLVINGKLYGPSTFIIDPELIGDNTGKVQIKGDLEVLGNQTTIHSSIVDICDNRIRLNALNDYNAGIDISINDSTKSFIYQFVDNVWILNDASLNIQGNLEVSNNLLVKGDITCINNIYGDLTGSVDGNLVGNVTGDVVGNVTGNLTGNVNGNAQTSTNATNLENSLSTWLSTGNRIWYATGNNTLTLEAGNCGIMIRKDNNTTSGENDSQNDGFTGSHNYHKRSDDRMKHNEIILTDTLRIIRQLTPKKYKFTPSKLFAADYNGTIDVPWHWEAGLIAQEVLTIQDLSWCVKGGDYVDNSGNTIEEPYSLGYNNILIYSLQATKELDAIVQNQENEINELKNKNTILENEIHTMKTALNLLLTQANLTNI